MAKKNCPFGKKDSHSCYWCAWRDGDRCGHPDYIEPMSEPAAEQLYHLKLTEEETSILLQALDYFTCNNQNLTMDKFEIVERAQNKIAEVIES